MSLPKIFKPKNNFSLIRCGRNNDGGYLITQRSILEARILISFGILDDISFEKDFLKINPTINYCYDKTLTSSYWKKRLFNDMGAAIFNLNFKFFKNTLIKYFEVKSFFKNKNTSLFVETIKEGSIQRIIDNISIENNIFFKIDIEGSEYRLLNELINNQKKICGLIIEFHDIDLHLEKVQSFIKNFELILTHIHPNNYGGLDANNNPIVIEMTFERNPEQDKNLSLSLPHPLDQANNPYAKDIKINFKLM